MVNNSFLSSDIILLCVDCLFQKSDRYFMFGFLAGRHFPFQLYFWGLLQTCRTVGFVSKNKTMKKRRNWKNRGCRKERKTVEEKGSENRGKPASGQPAACLNSPDGSISPSFPPFFTLHQLREKWAKNGKQLTKINPKSCKVYPPIHPSVCLSVHMYVLSVCTAWRPWRNEAAAATATMKE